MGQVLATFQDKLHGRKWREKQIRKITDKAFDRVGGGSGKESLTFEDLYIAVLCIYNDMNKHLPGSHNDPPSKEKIRAMMEEYDVNLDGLLDREEFAEFIRKLTADTLTVVSLNLIIALILAPAVALATKRATEGVPGVGKVVQRLPSSVYASIVTLGVVLVIRQFQQRARDQTQIHCWIKGLSERRRRRTCRNRKPRRAVGSQLSPSGWRTTCWNEKRAGSVVQTAVPWNGLQTVVGLNRSMERFAPGLLCL